VKVVLCCVISQWIVAVFAIASIVLVFALAFKSRDYPANFALLAAFVSIALGHYYEIFYLD